MLLFIVSTVAQSINIDGQFMVIIVIIIIVWFKSSIKGLSRKQAAGFTDKSLNSQAFQYLKKLSKMHRRK